MPRSLSQWKCEYRVGAADNTRGRAASRQSDQVTAPRGQKIARRENHENTQKIHHSLPIVNSTKPPK